MIGSNKWKEEKRILYIILLILKDSDKLIISNKYAYNLFKKSIYLEYFKIIFYNKVE